MADEKLLSVSGLHASAGEASILKGLDLEMASGEVHAVMRKLVNRGFTVETPITGGPAHVTLFSRSDPVLETWGRYVVAARSVELRRISIGIAAEPAVSSRTAGG